jgi:hypothetical protein
MEIKYQLNNKMIVIKTKGKLNLSTLLKKSLKSNNYDYYKFFEDNGFECEKCRICKITYPPLDFNCYLDGDFLKIKGFKLKKSKIYCYGQNKNCPGIKMNSNSAEFISKTLNMSLEEALIHIKKNNKSSFYKENWKDLEEYKKSQRRDINFFKKKYDNNWEIEYKKYKNKISKSNSLERYILEYGEKDGLEVFNLISSKKDSMSFKFFLEKNLNDYNKALIDFQNRKKSVVLNIDGFVNRDGIELGNYKYNNFIDKKRNKMLDLLSNMTIEERYKKYSMSIDNLCSKYGCIDGKIKYDNWVNSCLVPMLRASKESMIIFNRVIDYLNNINILDFYVGYMDKSEYFLKDGSKIFFYDFTIKSLKIIIEYNGVAFHPKLENLDDFKSIYNRLSSIELYNKQKYKVDFAKSKGFKVLEIWSDDKNGFDKCIEFIKNNMNKNE